MVVYHVSLNPGKLLGDFLRTQIVPKYQIIPIKKKKKKKILQFWVFLYGEGRNYTTQKLIRKDLVDPKKTKQKKKPNYFTHYSV